MRSDRLELRTERCYLFGKREWEARMVPQQRWDCEHLIFTFQSQDNFRTRRALRGQPGARTRYADWLGRFDLVPLPRPDGTPLTRTVDRSRDPYFAGRVMEILENGRVVVWGYRAGFLLKRGAILELAEAGGVPVARLRIVSHPGSFLITEIVPGSSKRAIRRGQVAFTNTWPKAEGLFGALPGPAWLLR